MRLTHDYHDENHHDEVVDDDVDDHDHDHDHDENDHDDEVDTLTN